MFGCTPIGPLAWTIALAASLAGTLVAAAAQRGFAIAQGDSGRLGATRGDRGYGAVMARYQVNDAAVAKVRALITGRQYVLDSDWGEVQPNAAAENAYLERHSWDEYAAGISASPRAPTTGPRRATPSSAVTSAGSTAAV